MTWIFIHTSPAQLTGRMHLVHHAPMSLLGVGVFCSTAHLRAVPAGKALTLVPASPGLAILKSRFPIWMLSPWKPPRSFICRGTADQARCACHVLLPKADSQW